MRLSRRVAVVASAVTTVIAAGPLVGLAHAATPVKTGQSPAANPDSSPPTLVARPSLVSVTFDVGVTAPDDNVRPSAISLTRGAGATNVPCTASQTNSNKTLVCTITTPSALIDDVYTVHYTAYNATLVPPSPDPVTGTFTFTIDTTAPILTDRSPASHSTVKPTKPISATFNEKLGNSSTITLKKGSPAVTLASTSSVTNDTITLTPTSTLTEAGNPYTVFVTPVDQWGNTASSATSWTFNVDATPPAAPSLTAPAFINNATKSAATYTGIAEPGSTVTVTATDSAAHTATGTGSADATTGAYSINVNTVAGSFVDGTVTATAKATDAPGNDSPDSASGSSVRDTVNPTPAPTVVVAPNVVSDAAKTIVAASGDTQAGVGVSVVISDGVHSTAPKTGAADNAGHYAIGSIDVTALNDGPLTATVTATDAAGNTSTGTDTTATKDVAHPGTPTVNIQTPINNANKAARTVSGSAENGSSVLITVTDASTPSHSVSATVLASSATPNYTKSFDLSTLDDGVLTATAVATDGAGNASLQGMQTAVKDTVAPDAPAYTPDAYINSAKVAAFVLSGTAEPNSSIAAAFTDVGAAHTVNGSATASNAGAWTMTVNLSTLDQGAVGISVTSTDASLNTSSAATGSSIKDTVAPLAPGSVAFSPVNGNSSTVTVTGTGVNGDSVAVTVTSDGSANPVTATGSVATGTFSVPVSGVADGNLTATAKATDSAGNEGPASSAATGTKDTTTLGLVSTTPASNSFGKLASVLSAVANEQLQLTGSSIVLKDNGGSVLSTAAPSLSSDKKTLSVTPTDQPLPDGAYTMTVTMRDFTGAETVAFPAVGFTIDNVAPSKPSVLVLGPANNVNKTAVPVSGQTTEKFGSLTVSVDDATPGSPATTTIQVGDSTTWSTTIDLTQLADGGLTAVASHTDRAGNVSANSTGLNGTKDTQVPNAPGVTFTVVGSSNAASKQVTGTGEPGATVHLSVDDANNGATPAVTSNPVVANGGGWTATLDLSTFSDGQLTATATQTDGVGNTSPERTASATKDTVAPLAPTASAAVVNNANKAAVPASGTGEVGALVTLVLNDADNATAAVTKTATVGEDGAWSTTVNLSSLTDGAIGGTATQADAAGNASDPVTVNTTKDVVAPRAPVISTSPDVGTAEVAAVTISGTGEAGDTVSITVDDADAGTAAVISAAPVTADGWSKQLDLTTLADGALTLTASQTDPSGNVSSNGTNTGSKDTNAPATPTVNLPNVGQPSQTAVTITGTGEELTLVKVSVSDGASTPVTSETYVHPDGWDVTVDLSSLADGPITASVTLTDSHGNVSTAGTDDAVKDTVAANAPSYSIPTVNIANKSAVPVGGTAASDGVTVHLSISDGANPAGTVSKDVAVTNGSWSTTVDLSSLADGALTGSATLTDTFGNVSASAGSAALKDTVAPLKPGVTLPNVGPGNVAATPVSGTGEPGSTVAISVDDTSSGTAAVTGTATVASNGTWAKSLDLRGLAEGAIVATATDADTAGNVSSAGSRSAVKDTRHLTTITLVAPTKATAGKAITVSGVAMDTFTKAGLPSGTVVQVWGKVAPSTTATKLGSATVGTSGKWSKTLTLTRNTVLQARVPVSSTLHGSSSTTKYVPVATVVKITSPVNGASLRAGRSFTVKGTTSPATPTGTVVALRERKADGSYVSLASAKTTSTGTWSITRSTGLGKGTHVLVVAVAATKTNAGGLSSGLTLKFI